MRSLILDTEYIQDIIFGMKCLKDPKVLENSHKYLNQAQYDNLTTILDSFGARDSFFVDLVRSKFWSVWFLVQLSPFLLLYFLLEEFIPNQYLMMSYLILTVSIIILVIGHTQHRLMCYNARLAAMSTFIIVEDMQTIYKIGEKEYSEYVRKSLEIDSDRKESMLSTAKFRWEVEGKVESWHLVIFAGIYLISIISVVTMVIDQYY